MNPRHFYSLGKKIIGVGRNYREHAKELGNAAPSKPILFLKPTSSYVASPGSIEIPPRCEVHHEIELGVVVGKEGRNIPRAQAFDYVAGYTLALDMTDRKAQLEAAAAGLPWTVAKGYDTFTAVGEFIPEYEISDPSNVELWLKVGERLAQQGSTAHMIFPIPHLIEYISSIMRLEPGDLILTGTPEGVGPVAAGDVLEAGLKVDDRTTHTVQFTAVSRAE